MQKQAKILKENSMNKFNALKTTTQRLERNTFPDCPLFQQAFSRLFRNDVKTFKFELLHNMNKLEKQLNKDILQEKILECKVQEVKAADSSSGDTDSSGIVSDKGNAHSSENNCSKTGNDQCLKKQSNTSGNESSWSRNECSERNKSGDDTDIRPSYDIEPMAEVPYITEYNVFSVETQHTKQPENMNDTSLMEKADSNTTPDSSDMCNNKIEADQNAAEPEDERVLLSSLISNFKLDLDENKKSQKQLKKANTSLTQELKKCKQELEKSKQDLEKAKQDLALSKQNLIHCKSDLAK
ncbi:hypothetical protein Tco_0373757 [Tanacetum coccineum]